MSRVVVLMGGRSAEREVSLVSGAAVAKALKSLGHEVRTFDMSSSLADLAAALTPAPDVVFNALHGRYGEDGCVQGALEILGIPYTHSGVTASAIAMDKALAKEIFAAHGIACAPGAVTRLAQAHTVMEAPYVVKPVREGSSVGVHIVLEGDNRAPIHPAEWPYGDEVLVERYVPGRELTVAVMDERPLGITEIRPQQGFYNYESKYTEGRAEHIVPADVPEAVRDEAMATALRAHRALGCRGVSRCDFRYDDTESSPGLLYLLEINTQPGMTPLSLVPEQAAHAGIGFEALVKWMIEEARCDS